MTLTLKARVHDGRLILDEPIDLPEGTEVDLVPANDGDDLDDADRARLHAAITRSTLRALIEVRPRAYNPAVVVTVTRKSRSAGMPVWASRCTRL